MDELLENLSDIMKQTDAYMILPVVEMSCKFSLLQSK